MYAMKRIVIENPKDAKETSKYFSEINIFKQLHHPNLIQYSNSFIHKNKLCIVMEYADKGDLTSIIKHHIEIKEYIPEETIWSIFIQLCRSLQYIHKKKIIHRDIKCQNVFISKHNIIKLGDFGISKILKNTNDLCKTPLGTPYYLSPEICNGMSYNFKSDIWMLGCVLYELMTLSRPFQGNNIAELMRNIVKEKIKDVPKMYSGCMKWLVKKLLAKNPQERLSIGEIMELDFVKKRNEKIVLKTDSTIDTSNNESDDDDIIQDSDSNSDSDITISEGFKSYRPKCSNYKLINSKCNNDIIALKLHPMKSIIKESDEEYKNTTNERLTTVEDNDIKLSQEKSMRNNFIECQSIISSAKKKTKRTISCMEGQIAKILENGKPFIYHKPHKGSHQRCASIVINNDNAKDKQNSTNYTVNYTLFTPNKENGGQRKKSNPCVRIHEPVNLMSKLNGRSNTIYGYCHKNSSHKYVISIETQSKK